MPLKRSVFTRQRVYLNTFKAIPDPSNGFDEFGLGTNFPAQTDNLDIHTAIGGSIGVSPDRASNFGACECPAGATCQKRQDVEFGEGKGQGPSLDDGAMLAQIDFYVADTDQGIRRLRLLAK